MRGTESRRTDLVRYVVTILKRCPECGAQIPVEMLKSYNENLSDYKEKGKRLRCPNCETNSLRGLWERVK